MTPAQRDDALLRRIAVMCIEALDPCNSREVLAQRVKDIFILAERDPADDENDE
jgi:hypothetical protein